jgi:hypothetical protein
MSGPVIDPCKTCAKPCPERSRTEERVKRCRELLALDPVELEEALAGAEGILADLQGKVRRLALIPAA